MFKIWILKAGATSDAGFATLRNRELQLSTIPGWCGFVSGLHCRLRTTNESVV